MPHAAPGSTGMPARWLRIAARLPALAITVAPEPNAMPSATSPPLRACVSSGTNSRATPRTPSVAATSVRIVSGVPKSPRAPIGIMNTTIEKSTATSPDVA